LGPGIKGLQNLFITVLASNKWPDPSKNGNPGDGVGRLLGNSLAEIEASHVYKIV